MFVCMGPKGESAEKAGKALSLAELVPWAGAECLVANFQSTLLHGDLF